MLDPEDLFELAPDLPDPAALDRPVLVQSLDGFIDAGGAARLVRDHLLTTFESRVVATFDLDQLLDYRARRPIMLFVEDHWESYDEARLELHLVHDAQGTAFLVLAGPEPDIQWERFTAAVMLLVERFGVRLTVGFDAIPMGVPHTRPIGITAHGTRRELVAGYEPWVHTVQVPASAGHLLEFRLGEANAHAIGFAVHVPHYLAQTEYPAAAAVLVDAVSKATGLEIPTDTLMTEAENVRAEIDTKVAESAEVAAVVRALEQQYDAIIAARGEPLPDAAELPTADELGAELERFLAEQWRRGDQPDA